MSFKLVLVSAPAFPTPSNRVILGFDTAPPVPHSAILDRSGFGRDMQRNESAVPERELVRLLQHRQRYFGGFENGMVLSHRVCLR